MEDNREGQGWAIPIALLLVLFVGFVLYLLT